MILSLIAAAIGRQQLRFRRLQSAWQAIAIEHEWLYVSPRGPWFNRTHFRLMIPSPYGAIEVNWTPGYRGSSPTTLVRSLIERTPDLSLHLAEKQNPRDSLQRVETGELEYDEIIRACCEDFNFLCRVLDADFRKQHLACPVEFDLREGILTLSALGYLSDPGKLLALLALNTALLDRLSKTST